MTFTEIKKLKLTSHFRYLKGRNNGALMTTSTKNYITNINDTCLISETELLEIYASIGPNFALLDWNDDSYKDLFFEYYGPSGSGVKYRIDVYEYNPKTKKYSDKMYSYMNPYFDFEKGMITCHYYGLGGGSAFKLKVEKGIKDTLEWIFINIYLNENFDSAVYYYTQKPFNDTARFTDNWIVLPPEYNYVPLLNADEP